MSAPTTISIDKLFRLIGTPKCPTLVDVRPQDEFEADPHLVPSSVHCPASELDDCPERFGGSAAILICRTGSSLSQRRGRVAPRSRRFSGNSHSGVRRMETGRPSIGSLCEASTR